MDFMGLFIMLLICGFLYWAWLQISPKLPIAEPFLGWINVLIIIGIGAIILFWIAIPLLRSLAHYIPHG